jgi:hypothetical protein
MRDCRIIVILDTALDRQAAVAFGVDRHARQDASCSDYRIKHDPHELSRGCAGHPKGVKISDAQLAAVNIFHHSFHGDWNDAISPIRKTSTRRK